MGLEGAELEIAVWAPLAAVEDQHRRPPAQQGREVDLLATLVRKREVRRLVANLRRAAGEAEGVESVGRGGEAAQNLARSFCGHPSVHLIALGNVRGGSAHETFSSQLGRLCA